MGLKKANHTINGYTYPEAYAVFNGEIKKFGNVHEVYFNVHASRELALTQPPLEVKKVRIENWDRQSNLVALAYAQGKEQREIKRLNPALEEIETVIVNNTFTGWEDDIRYIY